MAKRKTGANAKSTAPDAESNISETAGLGTLLIIGGHEDKKKDREILTRADDIAKKGTVVVTTLASREAQESWRDYKKTFHELGCRKVIHLDIPDRAAALHPQELESIEAADMIFFTGGDQLEITTKIGGTPLCDRIQEKYRKGMAIARTSAGASVMSETMLIGPPPEDEPGTLSYSMGPGLGFLRNVLIDQHFAQRGRIGRLLSAVTRNPRMLGIGIDENTAIEVKGTKFKVLGENSVYVVDSRSVTETNLSTENGARSMSVYNVLLHVLNSGDRFDGGTRTPLGHGGPGGHKPAK